MSHAALSPEQFQFIKATPKEMVGGSHEHRIGVGPNRSHGELRWHHKTGEILGIDVHPQFRRQGIATAMLGEARRIAGETRGVRPPRHSPDRTEAGEAWARSLGERLPARRKPTVSEVESHFRDMGVEVR
jgi:GNAT superfamily N-acetyltransferase